MSVMNRGPQMPPQRGTFGIQQDMPRAPAPQMPPYGGGGPGGMPPLRPGQPSGERSYVNPPGYGGGTSPSPIQRPAPQFQGPQQFMGQPGQRPQTYPGGGFPNQPPPMPPYGGGGPGQGGMPGLSPEQLARLRAGMPQMGLNPTAPSGPMPPNIQGLVDQLRAQMGGGQAPPNPFGQGGYPLRPGESWMPPGGISVSQPPPFGPGGMPPRLPSMPSGELPPGMSLPGYGGGYSSVPVQRPMSQFQGPQQYGGQPAQGPQGYGPATQQGYPQPPMNQNAINALMQLLAAQGGQPPQGYGQYGGGGQQQITPPGWQPPAPMGGGQYPPAQQYTFQQNPWSR